MSSSVCISFHTPHTRMATFRHNTISIIPLTLQIVLGAEGFGTYLALEGRPGMDQGMHRECAHLLEGFFTDITCYLKKGKNSQGERHKNPAKSGKSKDEIRENGCLIREKSGNLPLMAILPC